MSTPTLLIGLDGATFTILDPLMAQGKMPRLAALVRGGARAILRSTVHPLTPPAWTSLMTGRTPGNHGIMDFYRAVADDTRVLTVEHGARCTLRDHLVDRWPWGDSHLAELSHDGPAPANTGEHDFPGWMPWRHLRMTSRPQGLFDRLKTLPGFDPRSLTVDLVEEGRALEGMPADEGVRWVHDHIHREQLWYAITRRLMDMAPTPLTAILFDGTDKIQHLCYRLLDPAMGDNRLSAEDAHLREEAIGYHRELDGFIGALVDAAGSDSRVVIASDHGFGPWTHIFHLNAWLQRQGYLAWVSEGADAGQIPGELGLDTPRKQALSLDWSRTLAYGVSVSSNGLRIRRAGTAGGGGVAPEDYEPLRQRIKAGLLDVRDPETGERLARAVLTREEAYPGMAMDEAPDLTILLRDYGLVSLRDSEEVVRKRSAPFGTHHPDGILVAYGPGIRSGAQLDPLEIVDVAPTLLYSLGLDVPEDMEGRLPDGLFTPAYVQEHAVRIGPPTLPQVAFPNGTDGSTLTPADEAEITGRLRALGYVE